MTKSELRKTIAAAVKNLSPTYCREADAAICRLVTNSPAYQKARTIFCYVGSDREIDTTALLRAAFQDGKILAVPLCTTPGVMEARQVQGFSDLVSGKYGILAPKLHCPLVEPQDFDLAIVPCCTGNARGQRLGYGGGYYDRYLPRMNCPTMVLCRSRLVTEDIPVEDHDVLMTYLVTEKGITLCQAQA